MVFDQHNSSVFTAIVLWNVADGRSDDVGGHRLLLLYRV